MHRFTLLTLVVDVVLLVGCCCMYFALFSGRTFTNAFHFLYKTDSDLTDAQEHTIEMRFGCIFFPIFCILIAKVITGLRMVLHRFHRPVFMTYYVTSWGFYGSFLV